MKRIAAVVLVLGMVGVVIVSLAGRQGTEVTTTDTISAFETGEKLGQPAEAALQYQAEQQPEVQAESRGEQPEVQAAVSSSPRYRPCLPVSSSLRSRPSPALSSSPRSRPCLPVSSGPRSRPSLPVSSSPRYRPCLPLSSGPRYRPSPAVSSRPEQTRSLGYLRKGEAEAARIRAASAKSSLHGSILPPGAVVFLDGPVVPANDDQVVNIHHPVAIQVGVGVEAGIAGAPVEGGDHRRQVGAIYSSVFVHVPGNQCRCRGKARHARPGAVLRSRTPLSGYRFDLPPVGGAGGKHAWRWCVVGTGDFHVNGQAGKVIDQPV